MNNKKIILASKSPRRKELLALTGLEFHIIPAQKEEVITKSQPMDVVVELALQKAVEVYEGLENKQEVLVIGSDTIVYCNGEIMGKPVHEEDAFSMLKKIQGNTHEVFTGVSFVWESNGKIQRNTFYESTSVEVYAMDDDEIWNYVKTGEPMDKAGGYGIQGKFAQFVKGITGEYNNVVGLPIGRLYQELKKGLL